jgi:hypothetical protein
LKKGPARILYADWITHSQRWRKLHNEELHNFYALPNIIRIINKWGGEDCIRLLIGNSEGKRPLGRPTCRWMDNIMMDLGERLGWCGLDCLAKTGTSGELS